MPYLALKVHLHGGRYHGLNSNGSPEWPPSPARLFQAFVAAAAKGSVLRKEDRDALMWMEQLDAPVIAVPSKCNGQSFSHFMPNNDLDAVGGDPDRVAKIRTATKRFRPQIFDPETPFLYLWSFDQGEEHAERARDISARLYQLGRGVDMAWAVAEILDAHEVDAQLASYPGAIFRPGGKGGGRELSCPIPGSVRSLIDRYEKSRTRFKAVIEPDPSQNDPSRKKALGHTFSQPPKPSFRNVLYESPPVRRLYELRDMTKDARFVSWPFREVVKLVETVRNNAAQKLRETMLEKAPTVERVFGLCRDATEADKVCRIRIVPLPSVGHPQADHGIRRLLVEIPPNCPLPADDIAWAFSATQEIDRTTGEIRWALVPAEECTMLAHYGMGDDHDSFRIWRTVTPMALPIRRSRGRKTGAERAVVESNTAADVIQALRHAGISARPSSIRIQREPFDAKGARSESFAPGSRFAPTQLWHAELTFSAPITGPLLGGNGRYLGLGLMKPVKRIENAYTFLIVGGLEPAADGQLLTRALRRSLMALVHDRLGPRDTLPTFFTGHETDGSPARRGGKSHLAFAFDEPRHRLLVIPPHSMEQRQPTRDERKYLGLLEVVLAGLKELRAGPSGLLKLETSNIFEDDDPLFAYATTWVTQTDYRLTRYEKKVTPEQALIADVRLEMHRRGFPKPANIEALSVSRGPRGGVSAQLKLVFTTAVKGPLLIGKTCNFGGGLFVGVR